LNLQEQNLHHSSCFLCYQQQRVLISHPLSPRDPGRNGQVSYPWEPTAWQEGGRTDFEGSSAYSFLWQGIRPQRAAWSHSWFWSFGDSWALGFTQSLGTKVQWFLS
jgi:hypothetical protein